MDKEILCQRMRRTKEKGRRKAFGERNGGKYLDMESIFFVEEKKNRKLIGGKYLEKKNIFLWRRGKSEKEKKENSWRRRIFFSRSRLKT